LFPNMIVSTTNLSECFKQHPCSKHYLCRSNAVGGWDVIAVVIDRT
jgi:hypothetical protein